MRRSEPSEHLIRQRLSALTRALPAARQGHAESLHQARVATRRLRETLPLVASGGKEKKLDRRVRTLTRALGPVRELDVALQILDELDGQDDIPRGGLARLRQAILAERRALHTDMVRQIEDVNVERLKKRAIAAARRTAERKASKRTPVHDTRARTRVVRRAEALKAAISTAAGLYLPDRLHDVRIAVKKLRYALEVSGAVTRSRAEGRLRTLKKAQDLLGRMHDLEVLIARTRGVQGAPSAPTLKVSGQLDRIVRRLETECRQLHGDYISLRKTLLTLCDQVIAGAARRTAAA
jgi:CHAD domain-containing protein